MERQGLDRFTEMVIHIHLVKTGVVLVLDHYLSQLGVKLVDFKQTEVSLSFFIIVNLFQPMISTKYKGILLPNGVFLNISQQHTHFIIQFMILCLELLWMLLLQLEMLLLQPTRRIQGQPFKEIQGQPFKEIQGLSSKELQPQPSKEIQGLSSKEIQGLSSKEIQGQPLKLLLDQLTVQVL